MENPVLARPPRAGTVGFHGGPVPCDLDRRTRTAVARVLGSTVGLVGDCSPAAAPFLPGLSVHVARGPRRVPGWHLPEPLEGTGVSPEPDMARAAAVAEVVEAYCTWAPVDDDRLVRGSWRELGDMGQHPDDFAWPSGAQYQRLPLLTPLTADREVDWSPAWSLTSGCPTLVPAALVYADRGRRPPNAVLPELTSTGIACHVSLPHAMLAGLCEVLERDALAVAWYNGLPFTSLAASDTAVGDVVDRWRDEAAIDVALLSVPTDAPFPVVLAVARPQEDPPFAAVGAACRPDPVAAAAKAVAESGQVLLRLRAGDAEGMEPDDAAARYSTAQGAELLDRCLGIAEARTALADLPTASSGSVAGDLAAAVGALAASNGLEVLATELTTADVAAAGWRVVRVLVPGTVVPGTSSALAPRGATRLYQLPVRLGLRASPLTEDELRPLPVPLA